MPDLTTENKALRAIHDGNEQIIADLQRRLENQKMALDQNFKRILELEEANANCISRSLHDSRMWAEGIKIKTLTQKNGGLEKKIADLEEIITKLRDHLLNHGIHARNCAVLSDPDDDYFTPCTCGFSDALRTGLNDRD